jgi:HlyD family secretion protein
MRFAVVAALFSTLTLGLGYTYSQQRSARVFLTAPVERGNVATLVKANGTVEAVVSVDVGSQLSGRIAEVFVSFNDTIRAGQPIARLIRRYSPPGSMKRRPRSMSEPPPHTFRRWRWNERS